MIMTYVKVKGQSRLNVVKNFLLLPTLARRITKQVKDDDDLYKGQRSSFKNFVVMLWFINP